MRLQKFDFNSIIFDTETKSCSSLISFRNFCEFKLHLCLNWICTLERPHITMSSLTMLCHQFDLKDISININSNTYEWWKKSKMSKFRGNLCKNGFSFSWVFEKYNFGISLQNILVAKQMAQREFVGLV